MKQNIRDITLKNLPFLSFGILASFFVVISCTRIHPHLLKKPLDSNKIGTIRIMMNGMDSARASKLCRKEIVDSITSVCPDYTLLKIYISSDYWVGKVTYFPKQNGKRQIWEVDSTQPKIKYLNYDFKCN